MIAALAPALSHPPSEAATAHARRALKDLVQRRRQHAKACDNPACFLRVKLPPAALGAVVLRRSMRAVDDYEYDLRDLRCDIAPVGDVTLKVLGKAQRTATTFWQLECVPCMGGSTSAKWAVLDDDGPRGVVRRLMQQRGAGLDALEHADEALEMLWGRGLPAVTPLTLAAAVLSFAADLGGVPLDADDLAGRFGVMPATVRKCVERLPLARAGVPT